MMKEQIFKLVNVQSSPLFRIMSVYNADDPARRTFDNNITAFHAGDGYVLSVAHNLRPEAKLVKSISETEFQKSILSKCNENEAEVLRRSFVHDQSRNKRYLNISNQNDLQAAINALKRINFDTRWITQYEMGLCKPYLIVQFEEESFYNDEQLTTLFDQHHVLSEPKIEAHTFLIELELKQAFYGEDIALYKMVNIDERIVNRLPKVELSYDTFLTGRMLYCLQASPSGTNLGRMVNESRIEGILDHHAVQGDRIGGNYIRHGLRYLLKGYFRFGSSGAPYIIYDEESKTCRVNAIQSEASPIQLSIKNDRKGNFQYINAIASPLAIIKEDLRKMMV